MKKIFILSVMAIIVILPLSGAVNVTNSIKDDTNSAVENVSNADFTHTVLIEFGAQTTCGPCNTASDQLYSIYNAGDLDFYYVTLLVDNNNSNVRDRSLNELGVTSIPVVFFDGKYKHILGSQNDEQPYRNAINQSGEREVPDIDVDVDVLWKGGGTLKITVVVYDNEIEEFKGHIRTYIVEKESRWNDQSGDPLHYAVLDIPIDRNLNYLAKSRLRSIGDTYTFTKTWYGALFGFGDITKDNCMVIAAVFDKDTDYAVQTASAVPVSSGLSHHRFSSPPYTIFIRFLEQFPTLSKLLYLIK